jgi:hypothetical protein
VKEIDLEFMRERVARATLARTPRGIRAWQNALWEITRRTLYDGEKIHDEHEAAARPSPVTSSSG